MPNFPLLSNNTFSLATSFFYSQHGNAAEKALEIVDSRSLNKRIQQMLGLNIVIVRIDNMKMLITLYRRKVKEKNKNKNNKKKLTSKRGTHQ